jgi:type VI secretion system protein ImpF
VLDALLEEDPVRSVRERHPDPVQTLRDAMQRDLAILLNTRCRPSTPPAALRGSLADFGVEDFFNTSLVTAEQRRRFAARLQDCIRRFEPRLEGVEVSLPDTPDPARRSLRLRITATYADDLAVPPMAFETRLDPVTQHFTVATGGRT